MGQTLIFLQFRMRSLLSLVVAFLPAMLFAQLGVTIVHTNVACFGDSTGTATAAGTGGTAPYTYHWSSGATSALAAQLPAGTYTVTVTDAANAATVGSVVITQPFAPLNVEIQTQDQLCDIVPDGQAEANPGGGTPPYSYQWNTGNTTQLITGLVQGVYTVTVTDLLGCTTVNQATVGFSNEGVWLMIVPQNVLCFGGSTGSVHVSPMSGFPPYTYNWNVPGNGQDITNLPAGTYTVTVTNGAGCSNTASVTVTQPPPIDAVVTTTPSFCATPGSASVTPSGGVPPYTINWSNGGSGGNIQAPPGQISATITDSNGCIFVIGVTIPGGGDTLAIQGSVLNNAGCLIGGSATLSVSGGTGGFHYLWSNGDTTLTITNLAADTFSVTVTDAATGCTGTTSVIIPSAPVLSVNISLNSSATCLTGGSATATVTGGTAPYTYTWNTGQTTGTANNLLPGTVIVNITDSTGCTATDTLEILAPQSPVAAAQVIQLANCTGGGGSATASATGGMPPYHFAWSTGDTTATAQNLTAGTFTVIITDSFGCADTAAVTVGQVTTLTVSIGVNAQLTCISLAGVTATVTGGAPPFTYLWSNNAITASTSLGAGTHTVIVTDSAGCTASDTLILIAPQPPTASAQVIQLANCTGGGGSATASATGGMPPYHFAWSSGDTTATAQNLTAGTFTVIITDSFGCADTAAVTVGQVTTLTVSIGVNAQLTCISLAGVTATVTGGMPPFTYLWSNNAITASTSLGAGTHTVIVTDSAGCTASDTLILIAPLPPTASTQVIHLANCTGGGGSATASASGGMPPYHFAWSTGDTTATVQNLTAGTFTVIVTDSLGCADTASVDVDQAPPPSVAITIGSQLTCVTPASVTAVATNGTPPFTYAWSNLANTAGTNLGAGTYKVTVTDAAGCTATQTLSLTLPPPPGVSISVNTALTCAAPATVQATATGNAPPFSFAWSNNANTPVTNLGVGVHTVTVTDHAGCTATQTVSLVLPPAPSATTQVDHLANCAGSGGAATVTASGGLPAYTYLWSSSETTAGITGKGAGTYTVTVTDSNGCTATATVTIGQVDPPTVSASVTAAATCNTPATATALPNGGLAPYTFKWSNLAATQTVSGLTPGTYHVTITDQNACTAEGTVTVAPPPIPEVTIGSVVNAACNTPGSATAVATGGTPGYTYTWDNGITNASANNLTVGTHTVIITDAGGCKDTASVTIIVDPNNTGVDVGDFVWYDTDQNGFQHPLEAGVPNFPVKLLLPGPDNLFYTADDSIALTTVTDTAGKYHFTCVLPGTYVVFFAGLPAGYEFTAKDNVNNDCKDSDARPNGKTDPFTITVGQGNNFCVDAGIHVVCDNVMNGGIICCNQTICEGATPAQLYEVQAPAMGSGPFEYVWMQLIQVGQAPPNWVGIPGANSATYQPGPLFETAYFMRCVRRQGCITFLESNVITITVLPAGSGGCANFTGDFTVTALSTATVQVQWTTPPEMIRYEYTIERSGDKNTWTAIDHMPGYGDETTANHYQMMDHAPANGMNYYRIRRRSAGGGESISEVRAVELHIAAEESLAVYPNPVAQLLYIQNLMAYDADAQVEIFTSNGARLQAMTIPAGTLQRFEVSVADLPQGIYLTRIRFGNGDVKTLKVAKF